MKINGYLLGSALVAALGVLLFGFDPAVIRFKGLEANLLFASPLERIQKELGIE